MTTTGMRIPENLSMGLILGVFLIILMLLHHTEEVFLLKYRTVIHILGGALIIYMGVEMLLKKSDYQSETQQPTGIVKMFLSFFAVGITNPAAILTFLFAFFYFGILEGVGFINVCLVVCFVVCGVFIGIYLWWALLTVIVTGIKKKSRKKGLTKVNKVFGLILLIFGIMIFGGIETEKKDMSKIEVVVDGERFTATLYNNDTAEAFKEMLPMTLNMTELHGNEKYYYLDKNLPSNAKKVSKINTGDLMLYGSDCLVLFYDTFSTSYTYTQIGYIDDTDGLTEALGSGNVKITVQK